MNCEEMERIYLYSRFERFWHWVQGVQIIVLILTGFEVHGAWKMLGFDTAVRVHNWVGISWLVLYVFIMFWQATTGEWKHYIPTTKMLFAVAMYYMSGIFRGEPHPVPKSERNKHNPLQRLTYLGIAVALIPIQAATGILYYFYKALLGYGFAPHLGTIAVIHTIGAFALLSFLIVHVYMTTTGHSLSCHIRAMCSGWEEVPVRKATDIEKAA